MADKEAMENMTDVDSQDMGGGGSHRRLTRKSRRGGMKSRKSHKSRKSRRGGRMHKSRRGGSMHKSRKSRRGGSMHKSRKSRRISLAGGKKKRHWCAKGCRRKSRKHHKSRKH